MKRIKAFTRKLGALLLGMVVVFVILDGLAGVVLMLIAFATAAMRVPVGGRHAQYDAELGWVNEPSFARKDFYGPGADLHQNAHGIRAPGEVEPTKPAGKLRVLCSGDSFTFGSGVGDDHTFAHVLATIEPRLETVNLGVTAYGVDQAYLLYRREGARLDHDVHLFTFIRDDFRRMTLSSYERAGKPTLRLKDGAIAVENVPVPRTGFTMPVLGSALASFRASHFPALVGALRPSKSAAPGAAPTDPLVTALALFEELQRIEASRGATLVLMYLPVEEDLDELPMWQRYAAAELAARGIPFLDLTADFQVLSPEERRRAYLGPGEPAPGHFSNTGNERVARLLRQRLLALPAIAEKLDRLR